MTRHVDTGVSVPSEQVQKIAIALFFLDAHEYTQTVTRIKTEIRLLDVGFGSSYET